MKQRICTTNTCFQRQLRQAKVNALHDGYKRPPTWSGLFHEATVSSLSSAGSGGEPTPTQEAVVEEELDDEQGARLRVLRLRGVFTVVLTRAGRVHQVKCRPSFREEGSNALQPRSGDRFFHYNQIRALRGELEHMSRFMDQKQSLARPSNPQLHARYRQRVLGVQGLPEDDKKTFCRRERDSHTARTS